MNLQNIKVVLIETSHTGNMGSAARAMKTMGLSHLCLVNPIIMPDSQSMALSAGATDIIKSTQIVSSLDEAIKNCDLVIGTSARSRHLQWPHLNANECGAQIAKHVKNNGNVALIFGRERIGLLNDELEKCHYHVSIDANPHYSSLNLAMSVQVICYEIYQAALKLQQMSSDEQNEEPKNYPNMQQIEQFYKHLEATLLQVGFIKENHPGKILSRLRRLFTRAKLEQQELNILRGILSAIDKNQPS